MQRRGFTLIELLIVIVIIGILAVGFAPSLLNAPKKARDGVRKGQIAGIKQAVDAYALDNNSTYPSTGCIVADSEPGKSLKAYFQGEQLPVDQSPQDKTNCASGFYFYNDDVKKCYAILSKLEVGPGNSGDYKPDCATQPKDDKDKLFYAVTQKY